MTFRLARALPVAAFLLAGCNGLYLPAGQVTGPSVETNYRAQGTEFVVCTNLDTSVAYGFQFNGSLGPWTAALLREDDGKTYGQVTRDPATPEGQALVSGTRVDDTLVLPANTVPAARPYSIQVQPTPVTFTDSGARAYLRLTVQIGSDSAPWDLKDLALRVGTCLQ
ncbi:MAG TPA: hypothetical protein VHN99_03825 [Deinococcales bacterium]|nr:hypothetical protein [Deinococcales bacterium]